GPLDDLDISRYVPDGEVYEWVRNKHVVTHLLNTRGRRREEDYFAPQVFRAASEWLHEAASNRPFFLWVDSFMPHELWDPPANYADRYFPNDGTLKDLIYPGVISRIQDPSEALIRRTMALYAGCCTLVDTWIGHFLETLDKLRLWDDTLVIFVTDHGTELMDHGEFTKWGAWEGKLHPYNTKLEWFIRHPGGMRGAHVDGLVQSHDLTPTVLDILGLPGCELWDGRSAWPLVTGPAESIRERIITGWGRWASVRDCVWNCIIDPTKPDGTPRLFHVVRDPDENRDVARQYPEVVAEHRRYLEGLLGAPLPIRYKHQPDQGEYMTFASYLKRRGDAAGVLEHRASSQVAPPADTDTLGLRSAAA
ncbi:MAG: sulfatase-like hydrolase/transferase, partial [Planctomycetes bacterium]|nr:sulfatase-like hydrolase/transferase [Planctomycetota bacterium]